MRTLSEQLRDALEKVEKLAEQDRANRNPDAAYHLHTGISHIDDAARILEEEVEIKKP